MTASLKRILLAAACSASFALFGAAAAPVVADTTQPVIWCAVNLGSDAESTSDGVLLAYQAGRGALCQGDAAASVRALQAILPFMRTRYKSDGTHWIDYGRTYFYALLATHDDAGARRLLDELETSRNAALDERAISAGDFLRSGEQPAPDPHFTYALADFKAKDFGGATDEMQAIAAGSSLYSTMLGDLYAGQHDWPHAFAAWIAAAAAGPAAPQPPSSALDQWNASALEMIYAFRAHAPALAPAPAVFCGSPHDLAVVEQLALALPQSAGLNATSIVDASIVGDMHARVDVESKNEFATYFDLVGGQWVAVAHPAKTVAFPSGCANPSFVNH